MTDPSLSSDPAPGPSRPRRGPLPPILGGAARPLSLLYRLEIGRRNRRFDRGRGVVTFDRPVISVGNLSVGGTGKTPMVMHLARVLLAAGHRPCIAMRGYGSRGDGGEGESDEAAAYRRAFPEVPVVAQPDRTLGLIRLFHDEHEAGGPHSDCILLDDGFQHRRIARTLDIVLIDASRSPFADRLLPAGWLREPLTSLRRANRVVITHAESATEAALGELERRIEAARGRPTAAVSRHEWADVEVHSAGGVQTTAISTLRGRRLFAVCAIGNPDPFLRSAAQAGGAPLAGRLVLRDHDPYADATVERLLAGARDAAADLIITTGKDWSKLARIAAERWPCPFVIPRLQLSFDRGETALNEAVLAAAAGIEGDEDEPPEQSEATAARSVGDPGATPL